jgi:hypothetical protein
MTRRRLDGVVVATFALLGLRVGLQRLADNSGFTHLATGIRMVSGGIVPAIPRADPYTFTAAGRPWVVQSWLASAGVGWVYRLFGEHGVTVLRGLATGALAALIVWMAQTGRPGRTTLAATAALLIGGTSWAPRPLLVGLLCLALTIVVVERRRSPWWLVPLVWVWVNSHGSFPLGLLWLGLVTIGSRLDRDDDPVPSRYLGAFAVGLAAAAVNPLGPKLLLFAGNAVTKRHVFARVVEWQSPDFQKPAGTVALVGVVLAAAIIARNRMRWRDALPVVAFLALALSADRNLAPLGVVVAPVLGRALQVSDTSEGSRNFVGVAYAALALAALLFTTTAIREPLVDTRNYPLASIRWLERHDRFDAPHRVATPDFVGNYLELRRGPRREVFVDDRVDLFSAAFEDEYASMRDGTNRGVAALDRWHIDTLLWQSDEPLAQRLVAADGWHATSREHGWIVLVRN